MNGFTQPDTPSIPKWAAHTSTPSPSRVFCTQEWECWETVVKFIEGFTNVRQADHKGVGAGGLSFRPQASGRISSEPRSERMVCVEAPAYTLKFKFILFISLPHHYASSQHQTTHSLPDYRRKTQCERVPIPFLPAPIASLFPPSPFPFTSPSSLSDTVNQHSRHHCTRTPPFYV
jgi:hypothetical protein